MLREQRNDILYTLYESEYILEDGHSKKVKARHNEKKKNIEKRFYDNMNYKHSHTDEKGNKYGTVKRGDGPEVPITIHKKGLDAYSSYGTGIHMGRRVTRMKGSDLTGSHEYSHQKDDDKIRKRGIYDTETDNLLRSKPSFKKYKKRANKIYNKEIEKINKEDGFDKLAKSANKNNKIKDKHDKKANEIRADYYAQTTTKGENNSNRDRKHIDELRRRSDQGLHDDIKSKEKKIDKDLKENKNMSFAKAAFLKSGKKVLKKINDIAESENKKVDETRKKTSDYVMKKKKEEEKNKEK